MHIISTLLFSISANIDNLTVGIAYGIKNIKIDIRSNVLIAIISAIGTFISMSLGLFISKFLPPSILNIIGCIILIIIGMWFIADYFLKMNKKESTNIYDKNALSGYKDLLDNPYKADADNSGSIDIKESVSLALALTINNFGLGIGASITGLNILLTTCCTFVFSIITILLGYFLGNGYLSKILGKYASLISGIIIIILGIYEIFI